jgi:DNA polymerase-3 subunit alpha
MLAALDAVMARAQKKIQEKNSNQLSLFGSARAAEESPRPGIGFACPEADLEEWDGETRLKYEKEALGFFVSGHPLQPYSREIRRLRLTTLEEARERRPGEEISCALEVVEVKRRFTKKGDPMAVIGLEDMTGRGEAVFFPAAYDKARDFLAEGRLLCVSAKMKSRGDAVADEDGEDRARSQMVELEGLSVCPLDRYCAASREPVCVHMPPHRLGRGDMLALKNILLSHPGGVEVRARTVLDGCECEFSLDSAFSVRPGPELEKALDRWAS